MNLTVLIEQIGDDRYRAVITQPFQIESEGQTPDEAVTRVRELAVSRLNSGKLVQISIPDQDRSPPWARWAGLRKDNPDFDD